jgi:hypothetical protein
MVIKEYGPDNLEAAWRYLRSADVLIGHNLLGYDLPVLQRLLDVNLYDKTIVDTLVLSRLFDPTRGGGHSLEAWGRTLGYPKVEHEEWDTFSPEMQHRCTEDVKLNYKAYLRIVKLGAAFSPDSKQLEHDVARIIYKQIDKGWLFNTEAAAVLLAEVTDELGTTEDKVHETFTPKKFPIKEVQPKRKKDGTLSKSGLRPEEFIAVKASGLY